MHKILFLNDLSDQAPQAFQFAFALASRYQAILAQVCCNPLMELPPNRGQERSKHLRETLISFSQAHTPTTADLASQDFLESWLDDDDGVNELALEIRADLIVLPESAPRTAALAKQLVRKSPLPLLLIPSGSVYAGFDRLVFSTSFHFNDLMALNLLSRMGKLFHSKVDIIHVSEGEFERQAAAEKLGALAEVYSANPMFSFQLLSGDAPRQVILQYLKDHSAQLLAMTTHKRSGWAAFLESSTSEFMARQSPCPILITKDLEEI
ncbi:MAG: universal stress protein [Haliscomenobacter sp.]|nr:universal stress protein [Haliscomenobacter sp.]MBP9076911.1 universal stress protein [Haliscomenobacter sp.]MBP9873946.1 universal stress protein [Haliscomenobacter sp.]